MSATLNIDWLFQIASDLFNRNGINVDKNEFLKDIDQHILEIPPSNIILGNRCGIDARAFFIHLYLPREKGVLSLILMQGPAL